MTQPSLRLVEGQSMDKATALDARVTAWNQNNEQWNADSRALETERSTWVSACSDRRYREEDETAIRQGK